jgi:hypothetical protein
MKGITALISLVLKTSQTNNAQAQGALPRASRQRLPPPLWESNHIFKLNLCCVLCTNKPSTLFLPLRLPSVFDDPARAGYLLRGLGGLLSAALLLRVLNGIDVDLVSVGPPEDTCIRCHRLKGFLSYTTFSYLSSQNKSTENNYHLIHLFSLPLSSSYFLFCRQNLIYPNFTDLLLSAHDQRLRSRSPR